MIIFLADLQNSHYGSVRNSVPINLGFIAGYLKKSFSNEIDLYLFRRFEEIHEVLKTVAPNLVAFGSYSWNTSLTLRTAHYLRNLSPDTIIAVGGPDVSPLFDMTVNDLEANPEVDFYLPNEGEGPVRNLVECCLSKATEKDIRRSTIKGCLSFDSDSKQVLGSVIDRFEDDINSIPSPYLSGFMDSFVNNPDNLPIIQTVRGCPYHCTFCVSGKDKWSKIRAFDMDRVKAEIDYISERAATSYLRFAEENFGILPRDLEIAEYLMKKKECTGFPGALSLYTDKHPTKRVKKINLIFKDLLPFCISFQSTTPEVLKNIKRVNLKEDTLKQAIQFARNNDLLPVSELIFALPGETKQSFLDSVDKLIHYRFESIFANRLRILKGTEMDLPQERKKYGVKTMFSMSENGYTKHQELQNIEIDEFVVANNTLTENEYFDMNRFIFLLDFLHYRTIGKELLFFFLNYGIRTSELLMEVLNRPDLCPRLCAQANKFETSLRDLFQLTPDAVINYVREHMRDNPNGITGFYTLEEGLMIEMLISGQIDEVIGELVNIGRDIYYQQNIPPDGDFEDSLQAVYDLLLQAFIPLDQPSPQKVIMESCFDLVSWAKSKYMHRLDHYRLKSPVPLALRIREIQPYIEIWDSKLTLLERYKRYFAIFNSSNRKRFITTFSPKNY